MKSSLLLAATTAVLMAFGAVGASAETAPYSGQFSGRSDHITTGGVSIMKTENGGSVLILGADFSLDGAPDPSVALGLDGKYDAATNLGAMTKINGMQVYEIPDDLDARFC